MERLTTNKNVADMGMYELAHNCCYIAEDGTGRYRDYEMDMDERDFARNLTTTLLGEDLPLQNEPFDEEMIEGLGIDPFADVRGLIALFYRNMWAMAELREKLKNYEDAEEQGLLLRLLCKVGDTVYCIEDKQVWCCTIEKISISKNNGTWIEISFPEEMPSIVSMEFYPSDIGKTVFLAREEAEAKLKEMRNAHE